MGHSLESTLTLGSFQIFRSVFCALMLLRLYKISVARVGNGDNSRPIISDQQVKTGVHLGDHSVTQVTIDRS
jgi:hypothetical protein